MKFPWTDAREKRDQQIRAQARAEVEAEVVRTLIQATDPYDQPQQASKGAYNLDYPVYFTTPQSPRRKPTQLLDSFHMRRVADTFDVVRSVVEHLKRETLATPRRIVCRRGEEGPSTSERIREASRFFTRRGGHGGFFEQPWKCELRLLDDLLVLGNLAVFRQLTRGGKIYQQFAIDAATIRPRVDQFGFRDDSFPYEQWVQGVLVGRFRPEEMVFDGFNACSYTPYEKSPIEWLISPITSAMKADEWNRTWLTDGNAPGDDIFTLPAELSPDQIRTYVEIFDEVMSGNMLERRKARFLPSGSQRLSAGTRKEQDFQEFELWLLRRCCAMYGVQPASLGFAGEQYKVSQEGSMNQTTRFGAGAIQTVLKSVYDDTLECLGYPDLEYAFVSDEEEDAGTRADRLLKAIGKPWKTVNEGRFEEGLEPVEGGDSLSSDGAPDERTGALRQWARKAARRIARGKPALCEFESPFLEPAEVAAIQARLREATTAEEARSAILDEPLSRGWVTMKGKHVFIGDDGAGKGGGQAKPESAPERVTIPPDSYIPPRKITHYLLNPDHKDGGPKYRYLRPIGFDKSRPHELEAAIREHVAKYQAFQALTDQYGTRYNTEGPILGPNGETRQVTTAWILKPDGFHFVTLTPADRPKE